MAEQLKLIYVRSDTVVGFLIRLASWMSPWTHVGILTPERTVINARMGHGVVEEDAEEFLKRYSAHEVVSIDMPSGGVQKALFFARAQLGLKYDYGAVLSFIIDWLFDGREGRWHCIELAEDSMAYGGRKRFRVPGAKVTVQQSYMVR